MDTSTDETWHSARVQTVVRLVGELHSEEIRKGLQYRQHLSMSAPKDCFAVHLCASDLRVVGSSSLLLHELFRFGAGSH